MKRISLIVSAVTLLSAHACLGQDVTRADIRHDLVDLTPNAGGVTMGQWYTLVRDVNAAKQFWTLLGGKPITVDGMDVMKFHGVLVFLKKGEPTGGTVGTTIDHPGLRVPHGEALVVTLKAAGVKTDPDTGKQREGYQGMGWGNVYSPDGLKVEIIGDEALPVPVSSDHIHFFVLASDGPEMQAWYAKTFDAHAFIDKATNPTNPAITVNIPGIGLKFGKAMNPPMPTKGRALDHIGFEVKNLEAFCTKLKASGIKLDEPYSKSRHKSFASAELTDPWGTSIELTEGLNRF
jgi:catechol 2,3-dioxygenase-like lactoylglutathione lyase family enzyme